MRSLIRRALLVAVLCARAQVAAAAITFVNSSDGGSSVATGTLSAAGLNVTTGNLLVVMVTILDSTLTVSSVADTASNTFTFCTNSRVGTVAVGDVEMWFAANVTGNASDVVTATLSASTAGGSITVHQYAGAKTTSPFEIAGTGSAAAATSVTSGSFAPAGAGNVNVAYVETSLGNTTFTAGTNYILRDNEATVADTQSEDRLNAPSGSQTAAMSFNQSVAALISVASFLPAVIPCTPTLALMGVGRCG